MTELRRARDPRGGEQLFQTGGLEARKRMDWRVNCRFRPCGKVSLQLEAVRRRHCALATRDQRVGLSSKSLF